MPQEIAQNAVLMARKTQSFCFHKHIENEANSFRLHPFVGLLGWALQLDLHAFRPLPGLARSNRNPRKVSMQDALIETAVRCEK